MAILAELHYCLSLMCPHLGEGKIQPGVRSMALPMKRGTNSCPCSGVVASRFTNQAR